MRVSRWSGIQICRELISVRRHQSQPRAVFASDEISNPTLKLEQDEDGTSMVEFAIFLPFVLILMGTIIFTALFFNNIIVLNHAVSLVRQGYTRQDDRTIPVINDATSITDATVAGLLATSFEQTGMETVYTSHVQAAFQNTGVDANTLFDNSKGSFYAMVFAYEAIKMGMDKNVKYPCTEEGCAVCYPIPEIDSMGTVDPLDDQIVLPSDTRFDPFFSGVECKYYPRGIFGALLTGGLNALTGGSGNWYSGSAITRRAVFG